MSSRDTYAANAAKKLWAEMNRVHKTATEAGKAVVIEIMGLADVRVHQLEATVAKVTEENSVYRVAVERDDRAKGEGIDIKNGPDSAKDHGDMLDAEVATLKQDKSNISKELDDANDANSSLQEQVDGLEAQLKHQQGMYDSLRKRMSGARPKPKEESVNDGSMVDSGLLAVNGSGESGESGEGGTKRKADEMDGESLEK